MRYRPDIDGLRAVSVVAVLMFHYGMPLPGGFVGVDVFFVISGYLITSLLVAEMNGGSFSLLAFYDRRIRRILPALVVVVAATLVLEYHLLGPRELREVGASASYAVLGAANFHFYWHTGYFDTASGLMPLLHTWSLGVEEQFYVAWPLMLLVLHRHLRRHLVVAVLLLAAASLLASLWFTPLNQSFAFYMPFTRAWELGVGAALALAPRIERRFLSSGMNAAGLAAIAGSALWLTAEDPFPGWRALIPTIGAALIVWPKTADVFSAALSTKAPVFIGRISYSLYLWHWPLLVMFRHWSGTEWPGMVETAALVAVALVLSAASYRFVETPFRTARFDRRAVVAMGLATMAAVGLLGQAVPAYKRMTGAAEALRITEYVDYGSSPEFEAINRAGVCFLRARIDDLAKLGEECTRLDPLRMNVLLMGDSHAAHLWIGFRDEFPEVNFLQANVTGCRPTHEGVGPDGCRKFFRRLYARIADGSLPVDAIVLAGRWTKDDPPFLADSLDRLSRIPVLVVGPIVEYQANVPVLIAADLLGGGASGLADKLRRAGIDDRDREMREAVGERAQYVSLLDLLCDKTCTTTVDGVPLQWDYGHLTRQGSAYVARRIRALLGGGFPGKAAAAAP